MIKTIKIGDKDVRLNNNIGWTICYRDQFNRDIIPALLPMVASAMDIINGLVTELGKTEDISLEDVAKLADGDYIIDAIIHAGSLEFVDFINIVWALAKCEDDSIPEPKTWVKEFDTFYLDEIVPSVVELIIKGIVTSKNLKRLRPKKKETQPQE